MSSNLLSTTLSVPGLDLFFSCFKKTQNAKRCSSWIIKSWIEEPRNANHLKLRPAEGTSLRIKMNKKFKRKANVCPGQCGVELISCIIILCVIWRECKCSFWHPLLSINQENQRPASPLPFQTLWTNERSGDANLRLKWKRHSNALRLVYLVSFDRAAESSHDLRL